MASSIRETIIPPGTLYRVYKSSYIFDRIGFKENTLTIYCIPDGTKTLFDADKAIEFHCPTGPESYNLLLRHNSPILDINICPGDSLDQALSMIVKEYLAIQFHTDVQLLQFAKRIAKYISTIVEFAFDKYSFDPTTKEAGEYVTNKIVDWGDKFLVPFVKSSILIPVHVSLFCKMYDPNFRTEQVYLRNYLVRPCIPDLVRIRTIDRLPKECPFEVTLHNIDTDITRNIEALNQYMNTLRNISSEEAATPIVVADPATPIVVADPLN